MSLLGKYRREERDREDEEETTATRSETQPPKVTEVHPMAAVPNKERKSPIMSFSVSSNLRSCLQTIRNKKAINLSMWVERVLREAAVQEFPSIANELLE